MDLNTTWFLLIAVLLTGYAILDGFDLGVGVLHLFARTDEERRLHLNAIGPVWDGNEVWLLTAGGALFAAFPPVYATVFSGFYLAFVLLLLALIFRAVAIKFRGQLDSPRWRRTWDYGFGLGSLVPAILLGVAFGNVLRGLPLTPAGDYFGTLFDLLNPYALIVGALTLTLFLMHGALYMTCKTDGELRGRMTRFASGAWAAGVVLYVGVMAMTALSAPHLFEHGFKRVLFWVFLVVVLLAIIALPLALKAAKFARAFLASAVTIAAMMGLAATCLYPRLVPATLDPAATLDIYNASSTPKTLLVMLVIALIGLPLVLLYTAWIYWTFRGKTVITETSY